MFALASRHRGRWVAAHTRCKSLRSGVHGGGEIEVQRKTRYRAGKHHRLEILRRVGGEVLEQTRRFDQVVDDALRLNPAAKRRNPAIC